MAVPSAGGTNFPSESFTRGFSGSCAGASVVAASAGVVDPEFGLSLSGFRQTPGSLMSFHGSAIFTMTFFKNHLPLKIKT
jgi:hypothetical protein